MVDGEEKETKVEMFVVCDLSLFDRENGNRKNKNPFFVVCPTFCPSAML
jgi:hypothetical protein